MSQDFQISLTVNAKPIELTGFPGEFMAKTIAGSISSLKQSEEIKKLEITLNYGKVKVTLNGNEIRLGPFPTLMFANTMTGMVSTLKGVEGKVTSLEIKMAGPSL